MRPDKKSPLLSVEGLSIGFATEEGPIRVVEDVSFAVEGGETMGLVGESGCGKSVTAQTIMRLLPSPPSRIEAGRIDFNGTDLATASEAHMRKIRGNDIAMIFQEPMTSLNPTMTIGDQIAESLLLHRGARSSDARPKVLDMLSQVGIGRPEKRYTQYPHELSGGLRQRVMIAMALICQPKLLIADEPTTALDVTIQAQILELLKKLQHDLDIAVLLITHDLGVVEEMCREVVVMYAGRIVEKAPARALFAKPRHPYTAGLLAASPRKARRGQILPTIPGTVPPPGKRGEGCSFAERCVRALPRCRHDVPSLSGDEDHLAACWNPVP
jgi:oligopeptide/dipeptide ABC transporter ATP-binding protein